MIDRITQFANDMMANVALNALVNGDMYSDTVLNQVRSMRATREEVITMMGGLDNAVEAGMIPASEFLPLNVCGTVSNVLCQIFLDDNPNGYRFNYENRRNETGYITGLVPLSGAINGRNRAKSYLLRVDGDSHSYVMYLPPADDDAYLMQGNAARCMAQFTLTQWMNTAKSQRALSIRRHRDLLFRLEQAQVIGMGPLVRELVDTFSIDDDHVTRYTAFRATNMTFIFREVVPRVVKDNLRALYQRANVAPVPAVIQAA